MKSLETYFRELFDIHSSGAAVRETSSYGPLERMFNEIGKTLKPKVRCIINIQNRGADITDGGIRKEISVDINKGPLGPDGIRHLPPKNRIDHTTK